MSPLDDLVSSNPFPGLRPFGTDEADRFFGRDRQISESVTRLDEVSFIAVAGSSGCGKASLVRAGLLSALSRHARAGSDTVWRAVVMRPGNSPITNLAEQLSPLLSHGAGSEESRAGSLYGRLRLGGLGLVEAITLGRIDPHTRVLVVVDQFEEIFRFQRMTDSEEASAFIKLLLNAASDTQSPVSVVITVRTDALGSCADFRGLPEAVSRGQALVPKLTPGAAQGGDRQAGRAPRRHDRATPRQRLLNDVTDSYDDLPLMQHVLTRTWNHWAQACRGERPIDLDDYNAVGTRGRRCRTTRMRPSTSLPGLELVVEKVFRALTERITEGTGCAVRSPSISCVSRRRRQGEPLCRSSNATGGQTRPFSCRRRTFRFRPIRSSTSRTKASYASGASAQWTQAEAESRAMLLRLVEAAHRSAAKARSLWRGPELKKGPRMAAAWRRRRVG